MSEDNHGPPSQEAHEQVINERNDARTQLEQTKRELNDSRQKTRDEEIAHNATRTERDAQKARAANWRVVAFIAAIAALLFAIGLAVCKFHSCQYSTPVAAPETITFPNSSPDPSADAGKQCIEQQLKLLGSARADAVKEARDLYGGTSAGREFVDYVTKNPDGDPKKGMLKGLATLGQRIEWNFTASNGEGFHLDDKRKVCICHDWHHAHTKPPAPPVTHTIWQHTEIQNLGNGCATIDLTNLFFAGEYVQVPDGQGGVETAQVKHGELHFGYDTADGPLPPHLCGTIQQGHGSIENWYNSLCSANCKPLADYIFNMLDAMPEEPRRIFTVEIVDGHIRLTAPMAIIRKVMYFCYSFTLTDGRRFETRFFYLTPPGRRPGESGAGNFVSWGRSMHVTLNAARWPMDWRHDAPDDDHYLHVQ